MENKAPEADFFPKESSEKVEITFKTWYQTNVALILPQKFQTYQQPN
jgi:hypothetical protein